MKQPPAVLFALAAAALLLSSCPNPSSSSGPSIAGTGGIQGFARYAGQSNHAGILISAESVSGKGVTDSVNLAIHRHGIVSRAVAAQVSTDATGAYKLEGLTEGSYTVYASSPDSLEKAVTTSVAVTAGNDVTATDLNLRPTGQISGKATLAGAGSGNLGIMVFVAGTSFSAMTDDAGAYTISSVPANTGYVLVAAKDGYESAITNVNVPVAGTATVGQMNLSTHAGSLTTGAVSGTARLNGAITGNAGIIVYVAGTSAITTTDDSGSFVVANVTPGARTLVASMEGFNPVTTPVSVIAGTTANAGTLSLVGTARASTPTISPGGGQYASDQSVMLQTATPGATIYYTTNLSDPTTASSVYSTPISVAGSGTMMTIKAMAVKTGMSNSYVSSATYSITYGQAAAPTFATVLPGRYSTVQQVSLGCVTAGATIRYTTDGSQPSAVNGTSYTAPIAITAGTTVTIKAYAVKAGLTDSSTLSGAFAVTNAFVYAANNGTNDISAYSINSITGALTSVSASVAAGTGPWSLTVDPMGRFAYVANRTSNDIFAYAINPSTGALTSVGAAVAAGTNPESVTVDPTGRFVYVANQTSSSVSAYTINSSTGALTSIGAAVTAGTNPVSVTVDPTGRFVYVANNNSNDVSAYAINSSSGALTSIGAAVAAGTSPVFVTVDPTGRFVYVANNNSSNVSAYTINSSTGALTSAGTAVAAGVLPFSIAVDPAGKFVYVASYNSNNVSAYTINSSTGALTSIGTAAAGTNPRSVAVDPTGRFVYAANQGTNNVSAYTINSSTGALTSFGTAAAAGTTPLSLATTH